MSDRPDGRTLEALVAIELLGDPDGEARLSRLVAALEPHREPVEDRLRGFDGSGQSWRDYSGHVWGAIPGGAWAEANRLSRLP